jgi:aminopeptidase YwaD
MMVATGRAARQERIGGLVSRKRLWDNLRMLCDTIGIRYTGTESERRAAGYIMQRLGGMALSSVALQPYPMETWFPKGAALDVPCDTGYPWSPIPLCSASGARAEAELLNLTGDYPFSPEGIAGRIVLVDTLSNPPFHHGPAVSTRTKVAFCREHGCRGVIVKNAMCQGHLPIWENIHDLDLDGIPCAAVSYEDGERLQRLLHDNGQLPVRLETMAEIGQGESQNVIGRLDGTGDETIMVTAHYDTVGISPGASDNASSVVVLLEIANVLAQLYSAAGCKFNLLFVFFGSEELKLQGSRHYVDQLPADELARIRFMLNLDELGAGRMKGYKMATSDKSIPAFNAILAGMDCEYRCHFKHPHVLDNSGDSYPFAVKGVETAGLWRWEYPAESPHLRYRHMNFMEGGSLNHRFRHTAADTLDKLNLGDLRESATAIAAFISALVDSL